MVKNLLKLDIQNGGGKSDKISRNRWKGSANIMATKTVDNISCQVGEKGEAINHNK